MSSNQYDDGLPPRRSRSQEQKMTGNANFVSAYAYVLSVFLLVLATGSFMLYIWSSLSPDVPSVLAEIANIAAIILGVLSILVTFVAWLLGFIGTVSQPVHRLLGFLVLIITSLVLAGAGYGLYLWNEWAAAINEMMNTPLPPLPSL